MNKQTKEDLIKNCGKLPLQTRGPDGALVVVYSGRCNYYNDCDICNGFEGRKRYKKYESLLRSLDIAFVSYVDPHDKNRLNKKIRREQANALCIPQPDGTILYILNKDAQHKDIKFEQKDARDVLAELNVHHNLFPNGWRSTSGEWSLSDGVDEANNRVDEVTYQDMVCYFVPTDPDSSNNISKLELLRGAAMIWDGGEVTLDNIQHCVDTSVSAFIESAHKSGWELVPEKTKIISRTITAEQLKDWKVINIDTSKNAITYPNASKEVIGRSYPELVQMMGANTGIKNWRLWLIEYRENKAENKEYIKLVKEHNQLGIDWALGGYVGKFPMLDEYIESRGGA